MSLVTQKQKAAFDLDEIKRGYLIWGRHCTWNEGKAGFVTSAAEDKLIVQYYPGIGNVTNHFVIPVNEVVDGQWEIRWSSDMAEVQEYEITDESQQETEGVDTDDIGGTDS